MARKINTDTVARALPQIEWEGPATHLESYDGRFVVRYHVGRRGREYWLLLDRQVGDSKRFRCRERTLAAAYWRLCQETHQTA